MNWCYWQLSEQWICWNFPNFCSTATRNTNHINNVLLSEKENVYIARWQLTFIVTISVLKGRTSKLQYKFYVEYIYFITYYTALVKKTSPFKIKIFYKSLIINSFLFVCDYIHPNFAVNRNKMLVDLYGTISFTIYKLKGLFWWPNKKQQCFLYRSQM